MLNTRLIRPEYLPATLAYYVISFVMSYSWPVSQFLRASSVLVGKKAEQPGKGFMCSKGKETQLVCLCITGLAKLSCE